MGDDYLRKNVFPGQQHQSVVKSAEPGSPRDTYAGTAKTMRKETLMLLKIRTYWHKKHLRCT